MSSLGLFLAASTDLTDLAACNAAFCDDGPGAADNVDVYVSKSKESSMGFAGDLGAAAAEEEEGGGGLSEASSES